MKLFVLLLILCTSTLRAETLTFSTQEQEGPGVKLFTAILKEAYRRLGYDIRVVYEPLDRSIVDANAGTFDGDLFRGGAIESLYANLVRVPVPLISSQIVVFTKTVKFPLKNWSSLAPYQLTSMRGYQAVLDRVTSPNLTLVASWEQVFRMLDSGRTELVIAPKLAGSFVVRQLGLNGISILDPPLETVEVFHYLNKKRSGLVDRLAATLRALAQEGFLRKEYDRVVAPDHR